MAALPIFFLIVSGNGKRSHSSFKIFSLHIS
jgi:hypothetical protein